MNFSKLSRLKTLFQNHPKTIFCIALCILTIAAYWPVKEYPFIGYDDGAYVFSNSKVTSGLTVQNILWAFSLSDATLEEGQYYWHPLALISHMTDVQLFGVDPHMHHMSNLFFHTLNTILLFLIFSLMTGDFLKCFFMAVLFGLHPMNIESVAWIAERKNLLSATFWMITILTYVVYAKKPSIPRYLLVFFALGCGLMAKTNIAVLPCALLLLDYWPLKRMKCAPGPTINTHIKRLPKPPFVKTSAWQLVFEKIPLLLLSFAAIRISTLMLQGHSQVISSAAHPLSIRIENAVVSYGVYLYKMIWPVDLAVFYPFPDTIPAWQIIGAIIFLTVVTGLTLAKAKAKPYLIIGWLWFLGVLFPLIGLVQVGQWPALADRHAYVPMIGIFIIIAWGIPDLLSRWPFKKTILVLPAACLIIVLFWGTRIQLGFWTDTYTLFNRALAITENNFLAYRLVGKELARKGDYKTAEKYYLSALSVKPDDADAMLDMGELAYENNEYDKAMEYYQKALLFLPWKVEIFCMMGDLLLKTGKPDKAVDYYSEALVLKPSVPEIYNKLGVAFYSKQAFETARQKFETAVRLNPKFDKAYYNLGLVALKQGKINEATNNYKKAISIDPDYTDALKSLGDLSFSKEDMAEAFKYYSQVLQINPDDATTHYNIGVILFRQQQIKAADKHFYQALQIDDSYEKAQVALTMTKNILKNDGENETR